MINVLELKEKLRIVSIVVTFLYIVSKFIYSSGDSREWLTLSNMFNA